MQDVEDERQRAPEHIEATAGTEQQLQPSIPSTPGGLGEEAAYGGSYIYKLEPIIFNENWIVNLHRTRPCPSLGKATT
jgi:hypothetical protein